MPSCSLIPSSFPFLENVAWVALLNANSWSISTSLFQWDYNLAAAFQFIWLSTHEIICWIPQNKLKTQTHQLNSLQSYSYHTCHINLNHEIQATLYMHHKVSERTIKELNFLQFGKGSGYSSHQGGTLKHLHKATWISLCWHIGHSSVLHDRPVFVTGVGCGLPTMPASLHQFLGPTRSLHYCPEQQTQSRTARLGGWKGAEPEHLKEKKGSFSIISYKDDESRKGKATSQGFTQYCS